MATQYTDKLKLPYPDGNSPANVPADLKALAEVVESILDAPWTTYNPVLSGWSAGSGSTITVAYRKLGRTVHVRGRIVLGTSPAFTGTMTVSLPTPARADAYGSTRSVAPLGTALFSDASAPNARISGVCSILSANGQATNALFFNVTQVTSYTAGTTVAGTAPFNWDVGDMLAWEATYEAAS